MIGAAGVFAGGGMPSTRRAEIQPYVYGPETRMAKAGREALEVAIPVANAVSKYVLPAVGVTMAGQGLLALTDQMNQQTEGNLYMS